MPTYDEVLDLASNLDLTLCQLVRKLHENPEPDTPKLIHERVRQLHEQLDLIKEYTHIHRA